MKYKLLMAAFFGFAFHASCEMFRQDMLGLEQYLVVVRASWVTLHWGWGLACMLMNSAFIWTLIGKEKS